MCLRAGPVGGVHQNQEFRYLHRQPLSTVRTSHLQGCACFPMQSCLVETLHRKTASGITQTGLTAPTSARSQRWRRSRQRRSADARKALKLPRLARPGARFKRSRDRVSSGGRLPRRRLGAAGVGSWRPRRPFPRGSAAVISSSMCPDDGSAGLVGHGRRSRITFSITSQFRNRNSPPPPHTRTLPPPARCTPAGAFTFTPTRSPPS